MEIKEKRFAGTCTENIIRHKNKATGKGMPVSVFTVNEHQ